MITVETGTGLQGADSYLSVQEINRWAQAQVTSRVTEFGEDSVLVGPGSNFSPAAGDFTFHCRVRFGALGASRGVAGVYDLFSSEAAWALHYSDGNGMRFSHSYTGGSANQVTVGTIAAGVWYDCTIWKEGFLYGIRVNGQEESHTLLVDSIHDSTADFTLGSLLQSESPTTFIGEGSRIARAAYWDRALTLQERHSLEQDSAIGGPKQHGDLTTAELVDLVAWWEMNEDTGQIRSTRTGQDHLSPTGTILSVTDQTQEHATDSTVAAGLEAGRDWPEWLALSLSGKEEALRAATRFIDARYCWESYPRDTRQALQWPRYQYFADDDHIVEGDQVPARILEATKLALYQHVTNQAMLLSQDSQTRRVSRSKIDVIETQYSEQGSSATSSHYSVWDEVDGIIVPRYGTLKSEGSGYLMR